MAAAEVFQKKVDLQLLYARTQLNALVGQSGFAKQAFLQAALLQLHLALKAYISEITNGRVVVEGAEELLRLDVGAYDFRLKELQVLATDTAQWLSQLYFSVNHLYRAGSSLPVTRSFAASAVNVIASSGSAPQQWDELSVADVERVIQAFRAFIDNQRGLSIES